MKLPNIVTILPWLISFIIIIEILIIIWAIIENNKNP